jgi:hypothetical protein
VNFKSFGVIAISGKCLLIIAGRAPPAGKMFGSYICRSADNLSLNNKK